MSRRLTLAIIEAMFRILAAFPVGTGKAILRWVAWQRHLLVQANGFGPMCVAVAESWPPRVRRRKPPDRPVVKGG